MLNFRLNYSKGGLGWFTAYNVFLNKLQGPILPRQSRDRTNFEMVIIYGAQGSARGHIPIDSEKPEFLFYISLQLQPGVSRALQGYSPEKISKPVNHTMLDRLCMTEIMHVTTYHMGHMHSVAVVIHLLLIQHFG